VLNLFFVKVYHETDYIRYNFPKTVFDAPYTEIAYMHKVRKVLFVSSTTSCK